MDLALHCALTAASSDEWRGACGECAREAGAFFAVGVASRVAQCAVGVSTRLLIAPQLCTLLTVCAGSVAAAHAVRGRDSWRDATYEDVARSAACGLVAYAALGGGATSFAPSHRSAVGAFGRANRSLPATHAYASAAERGAIARLGKRHGCHSCGARLRPFIADHQPPLKFALARDAKWWTWGTTPQRFYPQCAPCSAKQAVAVRTVAPSLTPHLGAIRAYHAAGLFAAPLARMSRGRGPDAPWS